MGADSAALWRLEAATAEAIALVRVEDPSGVNALAAKQKLDFAPTGLTVIYGDNGSGKSRTCGS